MVEELARDFSKIKDAKSILINNGHEISYHIGDDQTTI
jgi:hypothetical protein